MKYIVGASIGGLFGLSMPLMMNVQDIDDKSLRPQESQPVEEDQPITIDNAIHIPDEYCGYIDYKAEDVKEQAKECLKSSVMAIPAI